MPTRAAARTRVASSRGFARVSSSPSPSPSPSSPSSPALVPTLTTSARGERPLVSQRRTRPKSPLSLLTAATAASMASPSPSPSASSARAWSDLAAMRRVTDTAGAVSFLLPAATAATTTSPRRRPRHSRDSPPRQEREKKSRRKAAAAKKQQPQAGGQASEHVTAPTAVVAAAVLPTEPCEAILSSSPDGGSLHDTPVTHPSAPTTVFTSSDTVPPPLHPPVVAVVAMASTDGDTHTHVSDTSSSSSDSNSSSGSELSCFTGSDCDECGAHGPLTDRPLMATLKAVAERVARQRSQSLSAREGSRDNISIIGWSNSTGTTNAAATTASARGGSGGRDPIPAAHLALVTSRVDALRYQLQGPRARLACALLPISLHAIAWLLPGIRLTDSCGGGGLMLLLLLLLLDWWVVCGIADTMYQQGAAAAAVTPQQRRRLLPHYAYGTFACAVDLWWCRWWMEPPSPSSSSWRLSSRLRGFILSCLGGGCSPTTTAPATNSNRNTPTLPPLRRLRHLSLWASLLLGWAVAAAATAALGSGRQQHHTHHHPTSHEPLLLLLLSAGCSSGAALLSCVAALQDWAWSGGGLGLAAGWRLRLPLALAAGLDVALLMANTRAVFAASSFSSFSSSCVSSSLAERCAGHAIRALAVAAWLPACAGALVCVAAALSTARRASPAKAGPLLPADPTGTGCGGVGANTRHRCSLLGSPLPSPALKPLRRLAAVWRQCAAADGEGRRPPAPPPPPPPPLPVATPALTLLAVACPHLPQWAALRCQSRAATGGNNSSSDDDEDHEDNDTSGNRSVPSASDAAFRRQQRRRRREARQRVAVVELLFILQRNGLHPHQIRSQAHQQQQQRRTGNATASYSSPAALDPSTVRAMRTVLLARAAPSDNCK